MQENQEKRRLIIGMSGASGAPLAIELLQQMQIYRKSTELHFIMTRGAERTLSQETQYKIEDLKQLTDSWYDNKNIGAGPASGSFMTIGMIVIPCSMKTLAGIVTGYSDNLLLRAADVTLKERRKLVLVTRECPLGLVHLRNMYEAGKMGAVILPPMLSYYNHPESIADCNKHIVGKIMDQFGYEMNGYRRWSNV